MAKIQGEVIVIKVSQLTKDGSEMPAKITDEIAAALVQVAEELIGPGAVVEIERA